MVERTGSDYRAAGRPSAAPWPAVAPEIEVETRARYAVLDGAPGRL